MAKFVLLAVLLLVAIAASTAGPAKDQNRHLDGPETVEDPAHPRFRRGLCEFTSYGVEYDSGCAQSCGVKGKTGICRNGVCECSQGKLTFGF